MVVYFEKGRTIWIWSLIWIKFWLNWKVLNYFVFLNAWVPPVTLVVSGGSFFLSRDTRRCFLRCLQVSSNSSLNSSILFSIEFWLKWALTWTSWTYICPNIANFKTQLALLSNLKVKLGCIIRTKRANFFLAYSSTFVTHVVTLLTAIVYKQVQGHIVVLDSLIAHVCVSIGKHKSDLYFGPDFFLLSFLGGFRKYSLCTTCCFS